MRVYIILFVLLNSFCSLTAKELQAIDIGVSNSIHESVPKDKFLKVCLDQQQLLLELPSSMLNTEMILVNHSDGYKVEQQNIIWSKIENQIVLETKHIHSVNDFFIPLENNKSAVRNILGVFPIIKDKGNSSSYWIDISDVFLTTNLNWSYSQGSSILKDLSFIKQAYNLKEEVIISTECTFMEQQQKVSKSIDFSIYLLPEVMQSRKFDYRMGFDVEDNTTFIRSQTSNSKASIIKWRLIKKHPSKPLSEPVEPIVFYLSSEIPYKWKSYVKAGILEWIPAFEAAGFKNAIEVKDSSPKDSLFSVNSVNYSKVLWGKYRDVRGYEDIGSATVTKVIDKRTGEILKSDIIFNATLEYLSDSYFIRCAPLDSRTQNYPFPDELLGRLIQSVIAHEAGHSFGIMDSNYGESTYRIEDIRDESWLSSMGFTPSIMNYDRHNFIAQPEDNLSPHLLMPKVGPADIYNIRWAYTPLFDSNSDLEDLAFIEESVRLQDSIPWIRLSKSRHETIGPGSTNEVVTNTNPIKGFSLGLKNLERVISLIPLVQSDTRDFALQERLYLKSVELWYKQLEFMISVIGGYNVQYKSDRQAGNIYTPILETQQKETLTLILTQICSPPNWLVKPNWRAKYTYTTYPDVVLERQVKLAFELIKPQRLKRIEYLENNYEFNDYSRSYLAEISSNLFSELDLENVVISSRKQALQRQFILKLVQGITQETPTVIADKNYMNYSQKAQSLFMSEILWLKDRISKSIVGIKDESTLGHLKLILNVVEEY
ncbi:zinc-dependent metalloprotease [Formosa sp. S-31]|uniref:zinc-dependent metalloprotease n=1 Tax=Formosa sp. S-31 TaxID=2790949 RepID=UPI003EC08F51